MKILLFVLIISTLNTFISFTICQDESLLDDQIITKKYPRKIKKVQILNPRKFLKVKSNENRKRNLKKRIIRNEGYTYFPAIANSKPVSDSPFLQPEHDIVPKVRVKKVLPDYLFTLSRGKRSINKGGDKKDSKNITKRKSKKKGNKLRNNDTNVARPKTKTNSTRITHKSKVKPKHGVGKSLKLKNTPQLKYTVKSSKKGRNLRKGKRGHKKRLRNVRSHKTHGKSDKTSRKKRGRRQEKRDSRRLIAGKDALISDYPYVVSIQKGGEHWCAGALVNQRMVITTANCIWKSDRLSRLRIRAGSRHADRGGQVAKIQEVMKHPRWSIRRNPDNDVAFILLDRNIKFSDSVHSLDLPNHAMLPAFEDAWVTSWGAERRDGIFENTQFTLQAYHTRLMDHDKCNNVTQRFGVRVSDNFICLTQTGRRAPCTRDTGAPAVSDGVLWGLASWGIRKLCGTERFPAMFSYLASPSNMQFIMNATHFLMAEERLNPFPDRFHVKHLVTTTEAGPLNNEYNT